MKNFKKSQKLKNVKYAIRGRLMEEANKLEQNGNSILKLNIGNPAVFNLRISLSTVFAICSSETPSS